MRIIDKKILKPFADAILCGEKTFEIRKNDEGYQKGDVIRFKVMESEYFEDSNHPLNGLTYEISYVLSGWGLENGYVALGIQPYMNEIKLEKRTEGERKAYLEGYQAGKKETMRWIPVSEAFPEEDKQVIVIGITASEYAILGEYQNGYWVDGSTGEYIPYEITHWMPLPEPYKGEE